MHIQDLQLPFSLAAGIVVRVDLEVSSTMSQEKKTYGRQYSPATRSQTGYSQNTHTFESAQVADRIARYIVQQTNKELIIPPFEER